MLLQQLHIFRGAQLRVTFDGGEHRAERRGKGALGHGSLRDVAAGGNGLRASLGHRLERGPFVLHVAEHGIHQIRDQVMAALARDYNSERNSFSICIPGPACFGDPWIVGTIALEHGFHLGWGPMAEHNILINRAPVLTLWAAVVAERLGFDEDEAMSLGKAVAGLNAQSKGQRLGIYKPAPAEVKKARARKRGEEFFVELLGRHVPSVRTEDGVRAVNKNQPVEAKSVERYLESKFGDSLVDARSAMRELAKAFRPEELALIGFGLYEKFRPAIPQGVTGWGAKGKLDLDSIRSLARKK